MSDMSDIDVTAPALPSAREGEPTEPIACDLSAIPPGQRATHFALARSLLLESDGTASHIDDGLMMRLPAERLGDVARFIENERRCCRHFTFSLEVPPRGERLVLRVTGPGARDELGALAR